MDDGQEAEADEYRIIPTYIGGERQWWREKPLYEARANRRVTRLISEGKPQAITEDVFSFLEAWWGDKLSLRLIDHIAAAHIEDLLEMEQAWPKVASAERGYGNVPQLTPGRLRPIIRSMSDEGSLTKAPLLLLYTDEVLADERFLNPFEWMETRWRSHFTGRYDFDEWQEEMRVWLKERLRPLVLTRPLIESGAIRFTTIGRFNNEWNTGIADELRAIPVADWSDPDRGYASENSDADLEWMLARRMAGTAALARARRGTIVSNSRYESMLWKLLFEQRFSDRRVSHLETLANFSLPNLELSVLKLTRLRNDSDAFARWRAALQHVLLLIADVDNDTTDPADVKSILAVELESALADVEREAKRSAVLAGLRKGSATLALSGLGAAAVTPWADPPWVGAVSAAAGGAAAGILGYIEELQRRRSSKLIWDLFLEFEGATG